MLGDPRQESSEILARLFGPDHTDEDPWLLDLAVELNQLCERLRSEAWRIDDPRLERALAVAAGRVSDAAELVSGMRSGRLDVALVRAAVASSVSIPGELERRIDEVAEDVDAALTALRSITAR